MHLIHSTCTVIIITLLTFFFYSTVSIKKYAMLLIIYLGLVIINFFALNFGYINILAWYHLLFISAF